MFGRGIDVPLESVEDELGLAEKFDPVPEDRSRAVDLLCQSGHAVGGALQRSGGIDLGIGVRVRLRAIERRQHLPVTPDASPTEPVLADEEEDDGAEEGDRQQEDDPAQSSGGLHSALAQHPHDQRQPEGELQKDDRLTGEVRDVQGVDQVLVHPYLVQKEGRLGTDRRDRLRRARGSRTGWGPSAGRPARPRPPEPS